MRPHRSLALAVGGAAALTLVVAQPATAATATTWTQAGDSWWSTASWTSSVPAAGDDVAFAGGVRSTYDYPGNTAFASFHFTNEHTVANGGGSIELTGGLAVDAGAAVRIEPLLTASASQNWVVGSGATLTLPSQVRVSNASTLSLFVDGTMEVSDLDGLATACIVKYGSGPLRFLSGGGGVGTCAGQPAGLLVAAGEVTIVGTANLGGKDFAVAGGLLTGGTEAGAAVVHALNLTGVGVLSPGASSGDDFGKLDLWGTSAWTGGTYQVDWDPAGGRVDLVTGVNQAISVAATKLDIRLAGTPTAGQRARIVSSDVGFTGLFASPAGIALAEGEEFTSRGQVYAIHYIAGPGDNGAEIEWLRAAPVAPPVAPPAPALAATGADTAWPLALAAVAVLGTGSLLVVRGRRMRARRSR